MKIQELLEWGRIVKGVNTTVDVGPSEIKTQAAKFGNSVDKDGVPPTLSKRVKGKSTNVAFNLGLTESIKDEDRHPNERPLGPETKPTMPSGTIRVKVSDVYDWYKLGQHISDLGNLNHNDFGEGPPDAVIAFGSEEEEHKYIKLLQKLGLEIIDVDPGAADAPGVDTDSTYNTENIKNEKQRLDPKCWKGYRKSGTKMKDGVRVNNCVKVGEGEYTWEGDLEMLYDDEEALDEAEYQGRKVKLGKPMQGDVKKFKVYVKNPKGNIVKVNFGDPDMKIKKSNPARRKSFRARHNCDSPGPRHKARYWSCRKW